MGRPSPISAALHDAFQEHFFPLLERLGFGPSRPERIKPGLVVAMAALTLGEHYRVEATLWCDGGTGNNLCFRLDVIEPVEGLECRGEVELQVPWPDRAYPKPRTLALGVVEFNAVAVGLVRHARRHTRRDDIDERSERLALRPPRRARRWLRPH